MAQPIDYATFSLLTGAGLAVGCYFSFRKRRPLGNATDEVFLGSKSLQMLPLAASVLATVGSATGVIGWPSHMYAYGMHTGWICVSNLLLIPIAVSVVVPVLYGLNITSVFQYVRLRYNLTVSVIASLTYVTLSQMVGAVAIYAAAVAVSTLFSISAAWCSVVIGLAATAYTSLGGLRSVVWADCLQALLTVSVPVIIIVKVAFDGTAGRVHVQPLSEIDPRKYFFNTTVDVTTDENLWSILIASAPIFINRICLDQGTAQRYLASRTIQEAKLTVIVGTLMSCFFYTIVTGAALALILRYRGCDPYLAGSIKRFDQLLPFHIIQDFRNFPGLSGLFLAGVVSASISTVSSIVNSQAAVWYFDVVTPFLKVPSKRVSCTIKALAFAVGGAMTALSVAVPYLGSALAIFNAVNAAITGPFVGLLLLGLTVPFANSKGAGIVTLLMVAYQVGHMAYRFHIGARAVRMPVSLDYCPDNATSNVLVSNITLGASSERSQNSVPLLSLSPFWSSFFSGIVTYAGGLALSLLIGGRECPAVGKCNLTSPLVFPLWQRLGCLPPKKVVKFIQDGRRELEAADTSEQVPLSTEAVL